MSVNVQGAINGVAVFNGNPPAPAESFNVIGLHRLNLRAGLNGGVGKVLDPSKASFDDRRGIGGGALDSVKVEAECVKKAHYFEIVALWAILRSINVFKLGTIAQEIKKNDGKHSH